MIIPPVVVNNGYANGQDQSIRFAFNQNVESVGSGSASSLVLATLTPIQTKVGDRVKLMQLY